MGFGKPKPIWNLILKQMRSKKKGFYRYIKCKRNNVEMLPHCLNVAEAVVTKDHVTQCLVHLSLYW